jgi:hypothetical protein
VRHPSGWNREDTESAQHIVPADDLILHTRTEVCTCAPRTVEIGYTSFTEWGPRLAVRKQVVHEAMDERE